MRPKHNGDGPIVRGAIDSATAGLSREKQTLSPVAALRAMQDRIVPDRIAPRCTSKIVMGENLTLYFANAGITWSPSNLIEFITVSCGIL
jgi:hypothetical protein